jgi:uncharacterized protein YgiM (DUF1202 family)
MVEITAKSLNLRATASATGAVVGSLKQGEQVSAPQPASGGGYVETSTGAKGYVSAVRAAGPERGGGSGARRAPSEPGTGRSPRPRREPTPGGTGRPSRVRWA